jgi:hypothetical protein
MLKMFVITKATSKTEVNESKTIPLHLCPYLWHFSIIKTSPKVQNNLFVFIFLNVAEALMDLVKYNLNFRPEQL